jgi:ABC-type uncharacterized transport system substrate-binding protein
MSHMRRREFITLLGGAAAWPLAARAQQPAMPVIGYLNPTSIDPNANRLRGFQRGLKETGYVAGENVTMEFRWAEGQNDRLPELAAELVRRQVSVIAVFSPAAALAAKAATASIPIVFAVSEDPVRLGLVASLARPGGNATGINFFTGELTAKRLELLRELVPGAARVAVLVNPADTTSAESTMRDVDAAARAIGLQIEVLTVAAFRENMEAGALISYGFDLMGLFYDIASYVHRIAEGAKPSDTPIEQSPRFYMAVNLKTAASLGVSLSDVFVARANEVRE